MALGAAAAPALAAAGAPSAAGVQPVEVPFPGGEPVCPTGTTALRIPEGSFAPGTTDYAIPGDGTLTITVVGADSNQTFDFSIDGTVAARQVFAKGGRNQNLYNYDAAHGFPNGIASDQTLHTPVNANNDEYFAISHIDFCFVPSPYNGSSTV